MPKIFYILAVIVSLLFVSPVMAGGIFGMPSPMDTEEGKWIKNKIHDSTEKYSERLNSKILKGATKFMKGSGWDKEENERAEEEYRKQLQRERLEHPEKYKINTL